MARGAPSYDCIVFLPSKLQLILHTHPLPNSCLNSFHPHHPTERFLYRSTMTSTLINAHHPRFITSLCSLNFFFHWLLVHSDFPSVLCLSFMGLLSLPIFQHLGVPRDHGLCSFLLNNYMSEMRLGLLYPNHLCDFFKLYSTSSRNSDVILRPKSKWHQSLNGWSQWAMSFD